MFAVVERNTEEWNMCEGLLRNTLKTIRIFGLERVQNRILWQRYSLEGRQMLKRNGGETNEKFLFHGTSRMDPYKIADQRVELISVAPLKREDSCAAKVPTLLTTQVTVIHFPTYFLMESGRC